MGCMSDAWVTGLVTGAVAVLGTLAGTFAALWMSRRQARAEADRLGLEADRAAVVRLVQALRLLSFSARDLVSLSRQGREAARRVKAARRNGADAEDVRVVKAVDAAMVEAHARFDREYRDASVVMAAVAACGDSRLSSYSYECNEAMIAVADAVAGLGSSLASSSDESLAALTAARQELTLRASLLVGMVAADSKTRRSEFRSVEDARAWTAEG